MSDLSKQAAFLSLADFVRFFLKTVIGIALARLLSPADLGSYRQLFLIYSTLAGVMLLGFPQSMQYFLPKAKSLNEQIRLISRTLCVVSILGIVSAALIYLLRNSIASMFNNPALAELLPLYCLYPIFMFITQIYSSVMLGLKESRKSAWFLIYGIVCDLILVLAAAIFWNDLSIIVWALLISAVLQWMYALWCLRDFSRPGQTDLFAGFKEQLAYTVPLGLSLLVGILSVQLDKLMISGFFNPESFAIFSLGAMELPLIGIVINSVNSILLPNLSAMDKQTLSSVYSASVRKNAIIVFPLAVVFYLFAAEFITFVYGSIYLESAVYFKIYLLLLPLRVATYGIIFQARGRTKLVMYDALLMLGLNALLNYLLIRSWGMQGAAWATVIVSWLILLVYLWQIKYCLAFRISSLFPIKSLFLNLCAAVIPIFAVIYLAPCIKVSFWRMILGGSLYAVLYLALALIMKVIKAYDIAFAKDLILGLIKR